MSLDYSIRISQRARRLQIKISPLGKVEVVLPHGMNASQVVPFVSKHQDWIRLTRSRLLSGQERAAATDPVLPAMIEFRFCGGCWNVSYSLAPGLRASIADSGSALRVCASDEPAARQTLQRWLSRQARQYMTPCLQQLSDETGLGFQRLTIRAQKSRWGSCSSSGTISLNRALMFLEAGLVRYLMLHELCHTRHMNHSRRYWAQVERLEPDYRVYEKQLRTAVKAIPLWARPGWPE